MATKAAGAAGAAEARASGVQSGAGQGETPKIYTEEEYEQAIAAAVSAESAKYEKFDEYKAAFDAAKAKADEEKSELQKMAERAEAAEKERDALKGAQQQATWIAEVSKATGVPAAALHGSTKEEIDACAESLKEYFATPAAPAVKTGNPSSDDLGNAGGDPLRELFGM